MSYDITRWKTKRLENFKIPIKELYTSERTDWHPKTINVLEVIDVMGVFINKVSIDCDCEREIIGIIENETINVTEFNMTGEGTGAFMLYVLEPAFKKSSGYLEAVLIWEGGDDIERLIVDNGKIKKEKIEL